MTHKEQPSWIDRYWPVLLITLGLIFILTLALFHPFQ